MTAAGNADLEKRMNAPTLFICRSRMLRIVMFAALSWSLFAESGSYDPLAYRTGLASIQALGGDLYHSLGATERTLVSSEPISFETSKQPSIRLLYRKDGPEV